MPSGLPKKVALSLLWFLQRSPVPTAGCPTGSRWKGTDAHSVTFEEPGQGVKIKPLVILESSPLYA